MSQKPETDSHPSKAIFHNWKKHEVTQRLFKILKSERERMVDGVIYDQYENPDHVKGRIQAIDLLLSIDWEALYGSE